MKKIISLLLSVVLALSAFSFNVFADGALHCPSCGGEVTKHGFQLLGIYAYFYQCNDCKKWSFADGVAGLKMLGLGDGALLDAADENTLMKVVFTNGHFLKGEQAPSGIGRKDLPGYSDNNVPEVSQIGRLHLYAPVTGWKGVVTSGSYRKSVTFAKGNSTTPSYNVKSQNCQGSNLSQLTSGSGTPKANVIVEFEAPITGTYYIGANQLVGKYSCSYRNNPFQTYLIYTDEISKGFLVNDKVYLQIDCEGDARYTSYVAYGYGVDIYVDPIDSTIKKQTNITINNNTWNGNIYVDNSNNLTYIYPQYTTINENNETVTNISTNPIIYNNETKQYYTYDSVTQNYYYIIYNENPATPTPSPSPTPDPDATPTPNPDAPTPTPKPSGDSDSNNSGGSSWNPFKWLTDLLKDIVETILKGLWKLLTSIFGFILWLLSLLFKLFPWMPNSGILALCAGVVVVTVIRIIKFITGR